MARLATTVGDGGWCGRQVVTYGLGNAPARDSYHRDRNANRILFAMGGGIDMAHNMTDGGVMANFPNFRARSTADHAVAFRNRIYGETRAVVRTDVGC